jgi:biofilm PGA synthesis N-glycosyltransferase PgaC
MTLNLQFLTEQFQTHWHTVQKLWVPIDANIEGFIYYYPLFMAYVWMFGAIIFYLRLIFTLQYR